MTEPHWANVTYPPIDYQAISYYSAPKSTKPLGSLDEVDPELLRTYERLGISAHRAETHLRRRRRCDLRQCLRRHDDEDGARRSSASSSARSAKPCRNIPDLVQKYLGSVVPYSDNFFAALNAAVFSDGSFCYVPQGRQMPHGAVDVLPHQLGRHRPVRAHADRRRRGRVGQLPRGMHGPTPRHEPAPCRGGRADRARPRLDQVLDRAELVRGRQRRDKAASTTS